MKLIIAIVQPEKLSDVKQALICGKSRKDDCLQRYRMRITGRIYRIVPGRSNRDKPP